MRSPARLTAPIMPSLRQERFEESSPSGGDALFSAPFLPVPDRAGSPNRPSLRAPKRLAAGPKRMENGGEDRETYWIAASGSEGSRPLRATEMQI